ncbi:MAG: hypothetical protein ACO1SV_13865 [Fimbriimonas sp.]
MVVSAIALLLFTPRQTAVTPQAFAMLIAAAHESDAAVPAALDALGRAALQPGFRLEAYQRAAGKPEFATDVRRLQVVRAKGGDREVVGVSVGPFSRLLGRDRRGPLAFPKRFDLVRQFEAIPRFVGKWLLVDGAGIQDAGVRYGYRVAYLAPTGKGFEIKRDWKGVWTLDEEPHAHLELRGTRMTLRTIEEPKTFFTSNVERLFAVSESWDLSRGLPRLLKTDRHEFNLMRAVDDWIAGVYAAQRPNAFQRAFREEWGEMRTMLTDWKITKGRHGATVILDNGKRFRFDVTYTGTVTYKGTQKP